MFIRDLEYCQIEVSDNQFTLVNGGGKKPPVKPAPKPKLPSIAISEFSVTSAAVGGLLASTTSNVVTAVIAEKGSAIAALDANVSSIAKG